MRKIILFVFLISCTNSNILRDGTKIIDLVGNPEYICIQSPYESKEIFKKHVYEEIGIEIKKFAYQDTGTVIWIWDGKRKQFKMFKLDNLYPENSSENRCGKIDKSTLGRLVLNINSIARTFSIGEK